MKRIVLFITLLVSVSLFAQKQYIVNGNSYTLKSEVEGTISLLWNIIDGEYRYFSKKGSEIIELKNTANEKEFQNEFKQVLANHTSDYNITTELELLTILLLPMWRIHL